LPGGKTVYVADLNGAVVLISTARHRAGTPIRIGRVSRPRRRPHHGLDVEACAGTGAGVPVTARAGVGDDDTGPTRLS